MKRMFAMVLGCALMSAALSSAYADEAPPAAPAETTAAVTNKPAPAAEEPAPAKEWSATVGGDWFSEYIFRGVDILGNDSVLVPWAVAKYKGFTASYYGYYGDSDTPGSTWYEEADLSLDYTYTLFDGKLALTAGGLYYLYPDGKSGRDTWELYGKAVWSNYLNPYIGINWDIDQFGTGYGVVGITHTYDLSKALKLPEGMALAIVPTVQLGIDFGYNSRATQSNVDWNDVLLGLNLPFNITPALCIHVQYQLSIALDSLSNIGQGNESIANVGISYTF